MSYTIVTEIELWCNTGNSDKVYNMELRQESNGLCSLYFAYGRRNSNLTEGFKLDGVDYAIAQKEMQKLIRQKHKKNYVTQFENEDLFQADLRIFRRKLYSLITNKALSTSEHDKIRDMIDSGHKDSQLLSIALIQSYETKNVTKSAA
jgi:predicted DNA-binding WGR domain protein